MGEVVVNGLDNVLNNLRSIPEMVKARLDSTINEVADLMYEELYQDCTLADIDTASLGYPYSVANGGDPPDYPMIHTQSGTLAASIQKLVEVSTDSVTASVFINEEDCPYIQWVVNGSSRMIPRPIFDYVWNRVQDQVIALIEAGLTEA